MRILVVEDEPAMREILRTTLEGPGVEVSEAESCLAASALLAQNDYDWVTLDMRLPDGCGFDLLPHIRAQAIPPRIILISGDAYEPSVCERAVQEGIDYIFAKPVSLARLYACIERDLVSSLATTEASM